MAVLMTPNLPGEKQKEVEQLEKVRFWTESYQDFSVGDSKVRFRSRRTFLPVFLKTVLVFKRDRASL